MKAPVKGPHSPAAIAGLLFNAAVWGLAWWPLRHMHQAGLHPLWATGLIFSAAVLVLGLARPAAWGQCLRQPVLWAIAAAAGTTNACFNWGVSTGDVVRVVLLFYLMPLWAVLLAWLLLGEAITAAALLRVALALAGALCVLWPGAPAAPSAAAVTEIQGAAHAAVSAHAGSAGLAWAGLQLADWLGLLGGFSFALNNVLIRRSAAATAPEGRGLAMFLGGAVVGLGLLPLVQAPGLPPLAGAWPWLALGLAALFLLSNMALQYSASRLPAQLTALLMLTEVPWAATSAWLLGAGQMSAQVLLGGALIALAALLAVRRG